MSCRCVAQKVETTREHMSTEIWYGKHYRLFHIMLYLNVTNYRNKLGPLIRIDKHVTFSSLASNVLLKPLPAVEYFTV
jgi:hypothetical protein